MMHANGSNGHPVADSVVDSIVAGGAAVTGLLAGTAFGAVKADPAAFVYAGVTAFLIAFFASLQAARNRKPKAPDAHTEEP